MCPYSQGAMESAHENRLVMVIAIDGPAGAGKSTVARAVAARLGLTYLDSGAMYRAVALAALQAEVDLDDEAAIGVVAAAATLAPEEGSIGLDGQDVSAAIRTPEVTAAATRIAVHGLVRDELVRHQRAVLAGGGWVCEGRDIGTVVVPDAALKVFLTADAEERARRRSAESGGEFATVLAEMQERDVRDRRRMHGALKLAAGAEQIDTSGLDVDATADRVVELARERGFE